MIETLTLVMVILAAVVSTASLAVSVAQYRRFVSGPQRATLTGPARGESPNTSISAGPPPVVVRNPEVPVDEWPERAPAIAELPRYGLLYRLDGHRHRLTFDASHGLAEGGGGAAPTYPEVWRMLRAVVQEPGFRTAQRLDPVPEAVRNVSIAEYARIREAWLGDRNSTGDPVSTCIRCGHVAVLRREAPGWVHAGPDRAHEAIPPYRLGVPEQPGPSIVEGP